MNQKQAPFSKLVFLVEDDSSLGEILCYYIKQHFNVDCRVMTSNLEVIEALYKGVVPNLMVLDYILSDGTAEPIIALCRAFGIPILLTSAVDRGRNAAITTKLPFVSKPFDLHELESMIKHLIFV